MKLSRKRLTRIRKMRHQTRRKNRKRHKKRRRRRRRSFRKNKLDMSNRTLRMRGGTATLSQQGGGLFSLDPMKRIKVKYVMEQPIHWLQLLLNRISLFIINQKSPKGYASKSARNYVNDCCTKEKMLPALDDLVGRCATLSETFINNKKPLDNKDLSLLEKQGGNLTKAWVEMSNKKYTSKMTSDEKAAFRIYQSVYRSS